MTRDELVDRMGANAPPEPKVVNRAIQAARAKAPPACSAWLKPLDSYDRQQRREYQVARFG